MQYLTSVKMASFDVSTAKKNVVNNCFSVFSKVSYYENGNFDEMSANSGVEYVILKSGHAEDWKVIQVPVEVVVLGDLLRD